ncbi:hypothetical protein Q5P01_000557 [Channa striata]|uniref:Uncharacterized protein n=1 Tax=Channa striata TaxID=64152 RepID=A0AA88II07_CHASR|nr:hypothetical protein Q5P01_000557 [Channa striata]
MEKGEDRHVADAQEWGEWSERRRQVVDRARSGRREIKEGDAGQIQRQSEPRSGKKVAENKAEMVGGQLMEKAGATVLAEGGLLRKERSGLQAEMAGGRKTTEHCNLEEAEHRGEERRRQSVKRHVDQVVKNGQLRGHSRT